MKLDKGCEGTKAPYHHSPYIELRSWDMVTPLIKAQVHTLKVLRAPGQRYQKLAGLVRRTECLSCLFASLDSVDMLGGPESRVVTMTGCARFATVVIFQVRGTYVSFGRLGHV